MKKPYNSISEFADNFSAFIIDLWGVLHDGEHPYKGAIETLKKLKAENKKIILLSNAPRRAKKAEEKLIEMGFSKDDYDHIITSGEASYEFLENTKHYGKYYYYIGPAKDQDLLEGLSYYRVDTPEKANFAIATGFDNDDSVMEEKVPEVQQCIKLGLPLICANPDMVVVRHNGTRPLCAGVIADMYEKLGGNVHNFGKPHEYVYHKCLKLLHMYDKQKIAAIGDNFNTDIAGANRVGIFSVLVTGGIMAEKLGVAPGKLPTEEAIDELCESYKIFPDAILPAFIW